MACGDLGSDTRENTRAVPLSEGSTTASSNASSLINSDEISSKESSEDTAAENISSATSEVKMKTSVMAVGLPMPIPMMKTLSRSK